MLYEPEESGKLAFPRLTTLTLCLYPEEEEVHDEQIRILRILRERASNTSVSSIRCLRIPISIVDLQFQQEIEEYVPFLVLVDD